MAGGGAAGAEAMADALKAVATARVVGPPGSATRSQWAGLLDDLGRGASEYLSPTRGFGLGPALHAEHEVAEGFRYLAHITRIALELHVEASPRFVRFVSPTLKLIGDNPDALYFISVVDPARRYNVSGCRNGDVYFSIAVQGPSDGGGFQRVLVDLNDEAIRTDPRGCFSVVLSPTRPSGLPEGAAWLELPPTALTVITRQYYQTTPPAQLNPAVLASHHLDIAEWPAPAPPREPRGEGFDGVLARRFAAAAEFVRAHTVNMPLPDPTTAPPFFSLRPNRIGAPTKWAREKEGMGAVDIAYGAGRFVLGPTEALLIRGRVPPCRFTNVVLWNRFLQTFDYASPGTVGPVSLNGGQLQLQADRRFTIVLGHSDPLGPRNQTEGERAGATAASFLWTEGRSTGTIFFRFVLPETEVEPLQTELVQAADVLAALAQSSL